MDNVNNNNNNEFEGAMINSYCALIDMNNCDFYNNENNGNGSTPGGIIYGESILLFNVLNSLFMNEWSKMMVDVW